MTHDTDEWEPYQPPQKLFLYPSRYYAEDPAYLAATAPAWCGQGRHEVTAEEVVTGQCGRRHCDRPVCVRAHLDGCSRCRSEAHDLTTQDWGNR